MHVNSTTHTIGAIFECVAFFVCIRCVAYDILETDL